VIEKFENGQSTRHGTDADEQKLKKCLLEIGFEVIVHRDLKRLEVMDVLHECEQVYSRATCI